jgi:hypothetical protein
VDRLPEETRFRDIRTAADVIGVFQNQGSSRSGEWRPLLSDVLFPGTSFSERPSEIRVSSEAPSVLRCEAMSQGKVLAVRNLVEGQDFRVVDGRLPLGRKFSETGVYETGAAIATETSVIRLTEKGDAVLSSRVSGVGLMMFFVPMAITTSEDALFERMGDGEPVATDNPVPVR